MNFWRYLQLIKWQVLQNEVEKHHTKDRKYCMHLEKINNKNFQIINSLDAYKKMLKEKTTSKVVTKSLLSTIIKYENVTNTVMLLTKEHEAKHDGGSNCHAIVENLEVMSNVFDILMVTNYCRWDQKAKCHPNLNNTNLVTHEIVNDWNLQEFMKNKRQSVQ